MNLMNLKDQIESQKLNDENPKLNDENPKLNDETKSTQKSFEESKEYKFEDFKKDVKRLIREDNVLARMKLSILEKDSYLIIYQGVRSNVKARFHKHKFSVYVNLIKRRLEEPISKLYHQ